MLEKGKNALWSTMPMYPKAVITKNEVTKYEMRFDIVMMQNAKSWRHGNASTLHELCSLHWKRTMHYSPDIPTRNYVREHEIMRK